MSWIANTGFWCRIICLRWEQQPQHGPFGLKGMTSPSITRGGILEWLCILSTRFYWLCQNCLEESLKRWGDEFHLQQHPCQSQRDLGWGGGAGLGLRPPPAFDPTSLLCVCGPGSILCKLISWSWVVMTVRVCLGCGPHVGRSSTFSTYDMWPRFVVMNKHKHDTCFGEIGLYAQNIHTNLGSMIWYN